MPNESSKAASSPAGLRGGIMGGRRSENMPQALGTATPLPPLGQAPEHQCYVVEGLLALGVVEIANSAPVAAAGRGHGHAPVSRTARRTCSNSCSNHLPSLSKPSKSAPRTARSLAASAGGKKSLSWVSSSSTRITALTRQNCRSDGPPGRPAFSTTRPCGYPKYS